MARTKESLRDVGDAELFVKLDEAKEELFNLRFQNVTGELENSSRLGVVRKQIARINTELREREIAAAEALAANEETD
ncbi:MAG: 50S ribosomal protein L29 [Acidimicrobiales bacterium]|jgi:large subunit ribosomal protein L29|nr:50S ribosomal protein L29 [Acidimicrobiales bacterium]